VQVVMEMCSESSAIHKILIEFVTQLFDQLADTDFFGFMMLRAARKPF
jgi:hypothetical protein